MRILKRLGKLRVVLFMTRRISRYPPIGVDSDGGERWGKKGTRCRPFEEMTCLICLYHAPRERVLRKSCSQSAPYPDDPVSLVLEPSDFHGFPRHGTLRGDRLGIPLNLLDVAADSRSRCWIRQDWENTRRRASL
ncbi:hypothetical protein, variant [Exophiala sideris]|uniref:Uncharacterized protein n=1 Tax=Exophiala sideris TaxID=1016849 RepID=A0A0D1WBP6_9EURO|nr:hypothetical protein PV11_01782 [Exophiala sideris]KIV86150.1 hypothetical protein, variant [Exophiala sideris]